MLPALNRSVAYSAVSVKACEYHAALKIGHERSQRQTAADSFGRDELPLVAKIADLAHTWIFHAAQRTDDE